MESRDGRLLHSRRKGNMQTSKSLCPEAKARLRKQKTDWQRNNGIKNREALAAIKVDRGCAKCGYNEHSAALDFNHIDPSKKTGNIAEKVSNWSLKKLMTEVDKCEVLCANCHRIHSYETHPTKTT